MNKQHHIWPFILIGLSCLLILTSCRSAGEGIAEFLEEEPEETVDPCTQEGTVLGMDGILTYPGTYFWDGRDANGRYYSRIDDGNPGIPPLVEAQYIFEECLLVRDAEDHTAVTNAINAFYLAEMAERGWEYIAGDHTSHYWIKGEEGFYMGVVDVAILYRKMTADLVRMNLNVLSEDELLQAYLDCIAQFQVFAEETRFYSEMTEAQFGRWWMLHIPEDEDELVQAQLTQLLAASYFITVTSFLDQIEGQDYTHRVDLHDEVVANSKGYYLFGSLTGIYCFDG